MNLVAVIIHGIELSDLIEVITSAAIVTIVTIMTIALPLIITAIHKLIDIYKTSYVMYLFNKDIVLRWFRVVMMVAIVATIFWVIVFFNRYYCLVYYSSIALCFITLALIFSLIILVARVVYYSLPSSFIKIIIKKIEKCETPERYFDPFVYKPLLDKERERERIKLLKEIDAFDEKLTFYFVILTHIFVTTDEELVRNEVKKYWEELCRKASKQQNNFNYYVNSYYNFIHKLEDWAIDNKDISLQKEAVLFTNIMLKAHLPEPRKYGEPENHIDERKYITAETRESLWKTIRKSIDLGDAEMFQTYWQIVNNISSIKYERSTIYNEPKDFSTERYMMYSLHYSCCAYLIATNKYNLLKYVLEYSQSHPFHWQLLPESIDDVIGLFIFNKDAYNDLSYEMRFSFSEDFNLYTPQKRNYPIEQFTTLLLYCLWDRKEQDIPQHEMNQQQKYYIQNLIAIVQQYPTNMEWSTYLDIVDLKKYKTEITQFLQKLIGQESMSNIQSDDGDVEEEKDIAVAKKTFGFFAIALIICELFKIIVQNCRNVYKRIINKN